MPTEAEIKIEIMAALPDSARSICEPEIDRWATTDNLDGKPILQRFYLQWKSGKKGSQNRANAWTGYHLGLTTKKPDVAKPIFPKRRAFARPSPPDIDSDFDYKGRQQVIDYVVDRYGRYNVGNIGTYGALKMKSAITRIVKGLDIANAWRQDENGKVDATQYTSKNVEKVTEIISKLPKQRGAVLTVNDDDTGDEIPLKTMRDVVRANSRACDDFRFYMDKYPEIMKHANNLEGLLSIYGVHASGIVISDVPLQEIAPLRTAKDTGGTVALATQFANEDLEVLGLIKFDILGLTTLTIIADAVRLVKENTGIDLNIEDLPLDPTQSLEARRTFELYRSGKLTGVFQCESPKMQDTCIKVGVDRFDDIMAVISLYRPGPMESIPEYCERKQGSRPVSYFHPTIEPFVKEILGPTYGVLVYQEQVMKLCVALAGMTVGDGYVVIKGIGKKLAEVIEKNKKEFVDGMIRNGVPDAVAKQYWEKFITPFALYGFNAAHSCCYAYNSYITAFIKANFPEEFMIASMNVVTEERHFERPIPQKGPPGVKEFEQEATRMGMSILPRDINKATLTWDIVRKKDEAQGAFKSELRPPIHCKGLSSAAAENLVANQPYNSIREVAEKTDSSVVNKEAITALCDAKFFKTKRESLLKEFETIREDLKKLRQKGRDSQNIMDDFA